MQDRLTVESVCSSMYVRWKHSEENSSYGIEVCVNMLLCVNCQLLQTMLVVYCLHRTCAQCDHLMLMIFTRNAIHRRGSN